MAPKYALDRKMLDINSIHSINVSSHKYNYESRAWGSSIQLKKFLTLTNSQ